MSPALRAGDREAKGTAYTKKVRRNTLYERVTDTYLVDGVPRNPGALTAARRASCQQTTNTQRRLPWLSWCSFSMGSNEKRARRYIATAKRRASLTLSGVPKRVSPCPPGLNSKQLAALEPELRPFGSVMFWRRAGPRFFSLQLRENGDGKTLAHILYDDGSKYEINYKSECAVDKSKENLFRLRNTKHILKREGGGTHLEYDNALAIRTASQRYQQQRREGNVDCGHMRSVQVGQTCSQTGESYYWTLLEGMDGDLWDGNDDEDLGASYALHKTALRLNCSYAEAAVVIAEAIRKQLLGLERIGFWYPDLKLENVGWCEGADGMVRVRIIDLGGVGTIGDPPPEGTYCPPEGWANFDLDAVRAKHAFLLGALLYKLLDPAISFDWPEKKQTPEPAQRLWCGGLVLLNMTHASGWAVYAGWDPKLKKAFILHLQSRLRDVLQTQGLPARHARDVSTLLAFDPVKRLSHMMDEPLAGLLLSRKGGEPGPQAVALMTCVVSRSILTRPHLPFRRFWWNRTAKAFLRGSFYPA